MNSPKLFAKENVQPFLSKNARLIWSISITIITTLIFWLVTFDDNSLFGMPFLGEAIVASVTFLLIYYFGKPVVMFIGGWIEAIATAFVNRVLNDFWRTQSSRLAESIKRADRLEEASSIDKSKASYITESKGVLLDTSAIIDGRILGVIKTGFMDNKIIVSQNVIDELKYMADKKNVMKREKGRRGLDMLREIKKACGKNKFEIIDLKSKPEDVDDSLVIFSKKNKTKVATVDYNLNKAAQVAGVNVLNINKLANEVRLQLLPGEILLIKLVQKGKSEGQAVGYLEDGTMIVVTDADQFIDEHKEVIVDKVLQTSAGRMIFASIHELETK